jgi:hypothetical protein
MSTPQLERTELLFRRQVALERNAPRRQSVKIVDGVPSQTAPPARRSATTPVPERGGIPPEMPDLALVASPGYFNVSRIEPDAIVWTILVGSKNLEAIEHTLLHLCNVQSAKKNFIPVFILDMPEQIEVIRRYGFTFEVLCDSDYIGMSREKQISLYTKKWNSQHSVDLSESESGSAK